MLDLIRQHAQSWGVKIAFGIIILVFVFWGVGSYDRPGQGTAAMVNSKAILTRDFAEAVRRQTEAVRAANPGVSDEEIKELGIRAQVLQMMVSRELMEQEAARLGITVSPAELYQTITRIPAFANKEGVFDRTVYAQALARQGLNEVRFEQDLARDLLQEKVRSYVFMGVELSPGEAYRRFAFQLEQRKASYVLFALADYKAQVKPSEEDLKAYYEANKLRFSEPARTALRYVEATPQTLAAQMAVTDAEVAEAFAKGPSRYHLRQIYLALPDGADAQQEAALVERLGKIAADLKKGADFAEVAAKESQDPSAAEGGDLGWLAQNRLASEVKAVVEKLRVNEISAPVRLASGYALFRLEGTDPDWSKPKTEINTLLRQDIAERKALVAFRDLQAQIEDSVALGKPLDEIAAQLKLEVRTLPLALRETLPAALKLRKNLSASVFDGKAGTLVNSILEVQDGFVVAEIAEQQPAGARLFDEVRAEVLESIVTQEASKLASKAAQDAMKEFTAGVVPDAFKNKVFTSAPFGRRSAIAGLGSSPAFTGALFTAPLGKWLDRPYEVATGAVIAMPTESIPVSEAEWQSAEPIAQAQLLEIKRNELFAVFMREVGARAKVSVPDPSIMQEE